MERRTFLLISPFFLTPGSGGGKGKAFGIVYIYVINHLLDLIWEDATGLKGHNEGRKNYRTWATHWNLEKKSKVIFIMYFQNKRLNS